MQSLQQGNQHALQLRQADLVAASSAGSSSPGASVGHRPLSRAHSSPVVGKSVLKAINFNPCSDQHLKSPYNVTALSNMQVTSMNYTVK